MRGVNARSARLLCVMLLLVGCAGADVPAQWRRFDAHGLRGAHPGGWQVRAEQQRAWPDATLEVVGPDAHDPASPVLVVYAEEGAGIDVEGRAAIMIARLEDELDARVVARSDPQVPGAVDGLVVEFAFEALVPGSADPVASRQFEVILDAADGRTFDMMLGGPADALDRATVDGILDALHIT